ncbi:hypothetical protein CK510_15740 [Brunnivagina elsteri CCALA 953]|uniref:Uncharacterized protein n=1 Tax=Brunnivagina elsteri CCALA 953 TaxID=987040 RepID=A0A2A2TH21_9CYAN|nr:hypothetical protein CK510_15740 [Calothrix elsteri CCALA 953]
MKTPNKLFVIIELEKQYILSLYLIQNLKLKACTEQQRMYPKSLTSLQTMQSIVSPSTVWRKYA